MNQEEQQVLQYFAELRGLIKASGKLFDRPLAPNWSQLDEPAQDSLINAAFGAHMATLTRIAHDTIRNRQQEAQRPNRRRKR